MRLPPQSAFVPKSLARLSSLAALICGASLTIFSCGNVSDPDPVKQDELKRPSDLRIIDSGNGAVTLSWAGTNNEDNFDGYNIFGMKGTDATLGTTEGNAIELLDAAGKVDATAKAILQKFNYNTETGKAFNEAGAKVDADKEISYLPRHNLSADLKPLLPSCRPVSTGTCDEISVAKPNPGSATLNGRTTFAVTGLTVGERYCFFIMSSMKEGKKTSASSSEVVCTVPKYKLTVQLNTTSGQKSTGINLESIRAACAAGTCTDLSTFGYTTIITGTDTLATAASEQPLYLENFSSNFYFTSGASSGITDMGYYANGFDDETLIDVANAYSPDTANTVQRPVGYTLEGESFRLEVGKHVYVVARKEVGTTKYYYDWIYISSATLTPDTVFTAEFRLSKSSDVLSN